MTCFDSEAVISRHSLICADVACRLFGFALREVGLLFVPVNHFAQSLNAAFDVVDVERNAACDVPIIFDLCVVVEGVADVFEFLRNAFQVVSGIQVVVDTGVVFVCVDRAGVIAEPFEKSFGQEQVAVGDSVDFGDKFAPAVDAESVVFAGDRPTFGRVGVEMFDNLVAARGDCGFLRPCRPKAVGGFDGGAVPVIFRQDCCPGLRGIR